MPKATGFPSSEHDSLCHDTVSLTFSLPYAPHLLTTGNFMPLVKASSDKLFPGTSGCCGDAGGAAGMRGWQWEQAQHSPGHPRRGSCVCLAWRFPWLDNKTPPQRLCNNINNSSYSLLNEKKLRMDRTGKRPVFLQACPNQNENKHLLTVQNGTLSSRAQAAPPPAWPWSCWLQT